MLNIMRKTLPLGSSMTPRLKPNLVPQFIREALRPLAARIMASDILHSVGMDILFMSTDIICNQPPRSALAPYILRLNNKSNIPNCVAN